MARRSKPPWLLLYSTLKWDYELLYYYTRFCRSSQIMCIDIELQNSNTSQQNSQLNFLKPQYMVSLRKASFANALLNIAFLMVLKSTTEPSTLSWIVVYTWLGSLPCSPTKHIHCKHSSIQSVCTVINHRKTGHISLSMCPLILIYNQSKSNCTS